MYMHTCVPLLVASVSTLNVVYSCSMKCHMCEFLLVEVCVCVCVCVCGVLWQCCASQLCFTCRLTLLPTATYSSPPILQPTSPRTQGANTPVGLVGHRIPHRSATALLSHGPLTPPQFSVSSCHTHTPPIPVIFPPFYLSLLTSLTTWCNFCSMPVGRMEGEGGIHSYLHTYIHTNVCDFCVYLCHMYITCVQVQ